MKGGAPPGAGRKRTRPLTLTEIGQRIQQLSTIGLRAEVRGRFLWIYSPNGAGRNYAKPAANALLFILQRHADEQINRLERKGAA